MKMWLTSDLHLLHDRMNMHRTAQKMQGLMDQITGLPKEDVLINESPVDDGFVIVGD